MNTLWIVEDRNDVYGPFYSLKDASNFCDSMQDRHGIKLRPLMPIEPVIAGGANHLARA